MIKYICKGKVDQSKELFETSNSLGAAGLSVVSDPVKLTLLSSTKKLKNFWRKKASVRPLLQGMTPVALTMRIWTTTSRL